MSKKQSGYRTAHRGKLDWALAGRGRAEATCAITTEDSQVLVAERRHEGASGLVIPLISLPKPWDHFEDGVLRSERLRRILDIDVACLEENAEVTYLGKYRPIPPSFAKVVLPCAVELDLPSSEIPISADAQYTWQDIGYVEEKLATMPEAPIHIPKLYDSHYTLTRYINKMTFTQD